MTAFVAGLCAFSCGVALVRWLRVSQREHYIAGSCLKFTVRWLRVRPLNGVLIGFVVMVVALELATNAHGKWPTSIIIVILFTVSVVIFPWPMPLIGKPRLHLTPRAIRLLIASGAVCACSYTALAILTNLRLSAYGVSALAPVFVDVASAVTSPMENLLLQKYRHSAESRLEEVSPTVIAVTGSWGKTSTKEHIRDLIDGWATVVASPASFNNTAGLSRTINELLVQGTEVLVAEMGMYKPGEIRKLCSWIRPHIAVITSVGPMHLERSRSMERIVRGKAEIFERADVAVLWVEDERLNTLADECNVARVWRVGFKGGQDLDIEVEVLKEEIVITWRGEEVGRCLRASGVHPGNVGCAVAAAAACGVTSEQLRNRLRRLRSPKHRRVVMNAPADVVVVDDTFNSNPVGAVAALEALHLSASGKKVVVTPGMVELGAEQFRANAELAAAVVDSGATLVAVGRINRRALLAGAKGDAVTVQSRSEAREWVRDMLASGDGVLWENDLPDHYP